MAYLHGVETVVLNNGPRPVTVVKSAVIAIVGIAPIGAKNVLTLVQSEKDAAQFGKKVPGFNIPQALDAIIKQGAGTILVVNTFDSTTNTSQVTDEVLAITSGKGKLANAPIGVVTLKNSDDSPATIVLGTDYTIDEYGNFKALTTAVSGATYKASYKRLNGSSVNAAQIIGAIDSGTGARSGFKCLALAKNQVGFNPKILITPGYSALSGVAAEMIAQAESFRAVALLDAPAGTTVSQAIAGRGIGGTINFNTSSKRAVLLYPHLKAYDEATDANQDFPYSSFFAGVMAATDLNDGYWFSPSNREIKGIVGAEKNITAGTNDSSSDANLLNEQGIATVFNTFGTGIRTWGNRNASYPSNTAADNFISVQRTADVIHESLENAFFQFLDQPITNALIDALRETGNQFIRALIQRGALIIGSAITFPPEFNTPTDIAAGKLTYNLVMMPPVPAERITIQSYIDINLFKNLLTQ